MAETIAQLRGVHFNRGKTKILCGIDWTIKKDEHWAVLGPNGSGKTTLLKILAGTLWPSSGEASLLGKAFGKFDMRELRKHIGWASSYLLEKIPMDDSIVNIIVSGKHTSFGVYEKVTASDKKQALDLLRFMGCLYLKERDFAVVSQGERQKIVIARSLMANPSLLVLDEPCTGLDPKARENVLSFISKICRKKKTTLIYVTHHLDEIVKEIPKVLMIKNGKVYFQGKKGDALKKERIKRLFE